uniref:Putative secreted peptide n=1 Tax=Anopheles braziliensis TaxID=58242 RepID=A0A2M3ZPT3_9DIPT
MANRGFEKRFVMLLNTISIWVAFDECNRCGKSIPWSLVEYAFSLKRKSLPALIASIASCSFDHSSVRFHVKLCGSYTDTFEAASSIARSSVSSYWKIRLITAMNVYCGCSVKLTEFGRFCKKSFQPMRSSACFPVSATITVGLPVKSQT